MPAFLRLRQICLAAPRLEPVVADLVEILGVAVCYRDPNVAHYGLHNALLPIGTDFLEVVSPTREDTAAGRFITRTRGHGGYMAIFQTDDPFARKAHAASLGVRTAHFIDRDGYKSAQLHPRDCRAAFIELGLSPGGEDRMGTWWPAGSGWHAFVRTGSTRRMLGIELESPRRDDLAAHWSKILQVPLERDAGDPVLRVEDRTIRFVDGPQECLGTLVVESANAPATLARAVGCGYRVDGDRFHIAGVDLRVVA